MKKNLISLFFALCVCTSLLHAQIKVHPNGTVNVGSTATPQLKINPTNGAVQIGNTVAPLFDAATRFEVNVPKAVIKFPIPFPSNVDIYTEECEDSSCNSINCHACNPQLPLLGLNYAGFQFYQAYDGKDHDECIGPNHIAVLTGLSNMQASIGYWDNQIGQVYSSEYYSGGWYLGILSTSDAKNKTNIRELSSMTDRIAKLRPVTYDFVRDGSGRDVSKDRAYQNRVGFIAQEMIKVFPELVAVNKVGKGEDVEEILSLDYAGLIPYLVKTIQELNEKVEKLEQQIGFAAEFAMSLVGDEPKTPQAAPKTNQTISENNLNQVTGVNNTLFQNVPNPFNSATTIKYQLGDNAKNAKICIYNLTGKQLQCYDLPAIKGENTIEVRASSLQSGMYLYSLIVNEQLVDTKRMILTE